MPRVHHLSDVDPDRGCMARLRARTTSTSAIATHGALLRRIVPAAALDRRRSGSTRPGPGEGAVPSATSDAAFMIPMKAALLVYRMRKSIGSARRHRCLGDDALERVVLLPLRRRPHDVARRPPPADSAPMFAVKWACSARPAPCHTADRLNPVIGSGDERHRRQRASRDASDPRVVLVQRLQSLR